MRMLLLLVALAATGFTLLVADSTQPAPTTAAKGETSGERADRKSRDATTEDDKPTEAADAPVKVLLSGKVVLLADALKQKKVVSYAEETKGQVVLVTREGELVPIVPDWRGRAFYQDERLRDRPVDLVVNRRKGVPWVQVLSIYLFDDGGARNIMDYWCDICAIPMYEIKECECCQGPIRLRLRPQELPKDVK